MDTYNENECLIKEDTFNFLWVIIVFINYLRVRLFINIVALKYSEYKSSGM